MEPYKVCKDILPFSMIERIFSEFEAEELLQRAKAIFERANKDEADVFLFIWSSPAKSSESKFFEFLGLKEGEVKKRLLSLYSKLARPEKIALVIFSTLAIEMKWLREKKVIEEIKDFLSQVIPNLSLGEENEQIIL